MIGRIFDIQRFSIHDGPGIRTTVFLKGCPLDCVWCHNPEGKSGQRQLSFIPDKCIGCGYCFRVCPSGAHRTERGNHILDRNLCQVCGACARECYADALEIVGRDITVSEVIEEVLKDRTFYDTSGGGVTLSGGEPLMQADFTRAILKQAKMSGLHTCIETCGVASFADIERILALTDLFLFDIKETNPARHTEFTGVSNEKVLANLRELHQRGANLVVRLPLIPGLNDRDDHFAGIGKLLAKLPNIQRIEVMPYHRMGTAKLARLGSEKEPVRVFEAPSDETVTSWLEKLASHGVMAERS